MLAGAVLSNSRSAVDRHRDGVTARGTGDTIGWPVAPAVKVTEVSLPCSWFIELVVGGVLGDRVLVALPVEWRGWWPR